jgi:hypothetical protein
VEADDLVFPEAWFHGRQRNAGCRRVVEATA